jgi:hypothetical protein
MSCSCSGFNTASCNSCTAKVAAYCEANPPADLSVPQDLSPPPPDLLFADF